jgi:hypothetical protein
MYERDQRIGLFEDNFWVISDFMKCHYINLLTHLYWTIPF